MRTYKTAITKPIPEDARFSTRKGVKYVTAVINGKKVTGTVTSKGTMRIESDCYSLQFRDNQDIERYIRAYTDQRTSEKLGEIITKLMEPGADMSLAENMPARIRDKLVGFGIIDNQRSAAGRNLSDLITEYESWLRSTRVTRHGLNRCDDYCKDTITMIRKIADACKFFQYSDISKAGVEKYLGGMNVKSKTYNHYLVAFKGFCIWVVDNGFASNNPIAKLKHIKSQDKENRRALSADEFSLLLRTTRDAPRRFELTGTERCIMYLLATEVGLRKAEIVNLTVSNFDLDKGIIQISREAVKNRKKVRLPLKQIRIRQFREYLSGKFPGVKLFPVTKSLRASDMLHKDLKDAKIPIKTDAGILVFHALRNTFSTLIAKTNATWLEHKTLTRHSLEGDVTAGYTEISIDRQKEIVEQLPGFEWPVRAATTITKAG